MKTNEPMKNASAAIDHPHPQFHVSFKKDKPQDAEHLCKPLLNREPL